MELLRRGEDRVALDIDRRRPDADQVVVGGREAQMNAGPVALGADIGIELAHQRGRTQAEADGPAETRVLVSISATAIR